MKNKGIAVFYHIAGILRWKSIVLEHLELLDTSELYDQATKIFFCFIGGEKDFEFLKIMVAPYEKIVVTHLSKNVTEYEFPTLMFVQNYVQNHNDDVLYFHVKGTSYNKENKYYKATNNWRHYMNFYLLKNWRYSVVNLEKYDVVGTSVWRDKQGVFRFFCGNYWWAKASYLRTTRKIQSFDWNNRWDAEWWLASGKNPKTFSWEDKYLTVECFDKMDTTEEDWQNTVNARFLNV